MVKHWYTNSIIDKKFYDTDTIPKGFIKGRTNYGSFTKGTRWITNGVVQKLLIALIYFHVITVIYRINRINRINRAYY